MEEDQVLDLPASSFSNEQACFIHTKKMPFPIVILLTIFLIVGIAILFFLSFEDFNNVILIGYFIGFFFLFLGCLPYVYRSGIDVHYMDRTYKEFTKLYGLKMGKWNPLLKYTDVSILTLPEGFKANSYAGSQTDVVEMKTGVYFLNASHRTRILIAYAKDPNDALTIAELLSKKLNLELKRFNPQRISRR